MRQIEMATPTRVAERAIPSVVATPGKRSEIGMASPKYMSKACAVLLMRAKRLV